MNLDVNCFSNASTFSSISLFIITSLDISDVLIHFSETVISVACFIKCLTFSKKCGQSISMK